MFFYFGGLIICGITVSCMGDYLYGWLLIGAGTFVFPIIDKLLD